MTSRTPRGKYHCGLLAVSSTGWFTDSLLACPSLEIGTISEADLGLTIGHNPYQLPPVDRADFALICTNWLKRLGLRGESEVRSAFRILRSKFKALIAIEGYDTFSLGIEPWAIELVDLVLKAQGVYKDRELYNWQVGPAFPHVDWESKKHPLGRRYETRHLLKLRTSLPCFFGADYRIRDRVRVFKSHLTWTQRRLRYAADIITRWMFDSVNRAGFRPPLEAFCIGSLTHIQRMDLLLLLQDLRVSGAIGITSIPTNIFGTPHMDRDIPPSELERFRHLLARRQLLMPPLPRPLFMFNMLKHKVVISPTGYGELTFRTAEAWDLARAVIMQDISNVDTMYKFEDMNNVIFCRPDFSDLPRILHDVRTGSIDYSAIGRRGQTAWREWIGQSDSIYHEGVLKHLDEVLPL